MSEPGTWNIPEIPEGDDNDIEEVADFLFGSEIEIDTDLDSYSIDFFGLD